MAVTREFSRMFGTNDSAPAAQAVNKADQPKAEVWINLGYEVEYQNENGETEHRFVSIPVGIPLDTQKAIDIKVRSPELADLQAHQNQLLADLQEFAKGLQPGEEKILNPAALSIQIRRVKDPVVAPVASETSVFARKVNFG